MKRIIALSIVVILILVGCGNGIDREEFVSDSTDLYVQMFTDGEQSEAVKEMYEEYSDKYSELKDDELYEAIEGMYNGLTNGKAAEYQAEVMRLLNKK